MLVQVLVVGFLDLGQQAAEVLVALDHFFEGVPKGLDLLLQVLLLRPCGVQVAEPVGQLFLENDGVSRDDAFDLFGLGLRTGALLVDRGFEFEMALLGRASILQIALRVCVRRVKRVVERQVEVRRDFLLALFALSLLLWS